MIKKDKRFKRIKLPGSSIFFFLFLVIFFRIDFAFLQERTPQAENQTSVIIPTKNTNIFNDIYFLNEKIGWIVGTEGRILYTQNGGQSFEIQASGTRANLLSIFMLNSQKGWAAGDDGTILSWDGRSWKIQFEKLNLKIFDIRFLDSQTGFAAAGNQIIFTQNGGRSWQIMRSEPQILLLGLTLDLEKKLWIYGGQAKIKSNLFLLDKTKKAIALPENSKDIIWDGDFVESKKGWLVGYDNTVLQTIDGGNSWQSQKLVSEKGWLYRIDFTDSTNGWIISRSGELFQTLNGGENWVLNRKFDVNLHGLFFINRSKGWLVGSNSTIYSTQNGGKSWEPHFMNHTMHLSYFKGAYSIVARKNTPSQKLLMHIPVIAQNSTPIAFSLDQTIPANRIKSFRMLRKHADNWLVELTFEGLSRGDSIFIPWQSWVLKKSHLFNDLSGSHSIQSAETLPDSVARYLMATKITQSNQPEIINLAKKLSQNRTDLLAIVRSIIEYTANSLDYKGSYEQDALSTLRNGYGVCNGKANLAVALLRALGVPARTLMVANTHFIIEYFVPNYGWVRAESTSGVPVQPIENNTVMWVATPEDENASPYNGIVCYWGTGSREVLFDILYNQAEQVEFAATGYAESDKQLHQIIELAQQNWRLFNKVTNLESPRKLQSYLNQIQSLQFQGVSLIQTNNVAKFLSNQENLNSLLKKFEQEITRSITSKNDLARISDNFMLEQNYPNPFNAKTKIQFQLNQPGRASIRVYNVSGQEVLILMDEYKPAGMYDVIWDATIGAGETVASGIYILQLEFLGQIQKRKAILLK
ncbi:T9SS type A sorting domain-containing protein [candidate division KSB1 bacterium]|nr:T9SS type A sorting domain-containing protein [candidate division KSB1 bacterium]